MTNGTRRPGTSTPRWHLIVIVAGVILLSGCSAGEDLLDEVTGEIARHADEFEADGDTPPTVKPLSGTTQFCLVAEEWAERDQGVDINDPEQVADFLAWQHGMQDDLAGVAPAAVIDDFQTIVFWEELLGQRLAAVDHRFDLLDPAVIDSVQASPAPAAEERFYAALADECGIERPDLT